MKTMILVILTAAITNNYVLVKFLGICPFLGVSKKLDQATGMSLAVIFVEVLATAVTWPIYHFLLAGKVDFTYMETVVFILVIAGGFLGQPQSACRRRTGRSVRRGVRLCTRCFAGERSVQDGRKRPVSECARRFFPL